MPAFRAAAYVSTRRRLLKLPQTKPVIAPYKRNGPSAGASRGRRRGLSPLGDGDTGQRIGRAIVPAPQHSSTDYRSMILLNSAVLSGATSRLTPAGDPHQAGFLLVADFESVSGLIRPGTGAPAVEGSR
jgi:hypothetical protein